MRPADGLGGVVEPEAVVYVGENEAIDEPAVDIVHFGFRTWGVEAREVAGGGCRSADLEGLVFVCEADRWGAACGPIAVGALGKDGGPRACGRTAARGLLLLQLLAGRGQQRCSLYG